MLWLWTQFSGKEGKIMASFVLRGSRAGRPSRGQRWVLVIVGLLLALVAAGCGGSKAAPQGAPALQPVKACEILAKADAEAVLGGTVDTPQEKDHESAKMKAWTSTCTYNSPQAGRGATLLIQNSLTADPAQALDAQVAALKKSLGDDYNPEKVAGVGDGALWDGSVKQLTVFTPGYMLVINVTGFKGEASSSLEAAKTVAEKVLGKLPK
jgi:hypothetical protein